MIVIDLYHNLEDQAVEGVHNFELKGEDASDDTDYFSLKLISLNFSS